MYDTTLLVVLRSMYDGRRFSNSAGSVPPRCPSYDYYDDYHYHDSSNNNNNHTNDYNNNHDIKHNTANNNNNNDNTNHNPFELVLWKVAGIRRWMLTFVSSGDKFWCAIACPDQGAKDCTSDIDASEIPHPVDSGTSFGFRKIRKVARLGANDCTPEINTSEIIVDFQWHCPMDVQWHFPT